MPLPPDRFTEPMTAHLNERLAEAARYAVLRRLAPALRHDMAGMLQPISMMAAMLEKRVQKPAPDMAALGANTSALNTMARDASSGCMGLMTWLAPKENPASHHVKVGEGVADAISLVKTELSFRGFNLVNETDAAQAAVPRSLLRSAFMAGLLALTDHADGPADVLLSAALQGDVLILSATLAATEGEPAPANLQAYRRLEWDDVNAIAQSENTRIRQTPGGFEIQYAGAAAA